MGLNPEKLDPNSVPNSLGTVDVMSPIEHMKAFTPDESGESPMDRFTLGMNKGNVSIMESGATAAQDAQQKISTRPPQLDVKMLPLKP